MVADDFLATQGGGKLDCLIIDLQMPGLNGLELQQQVNRLFPHVAVTFLSGQVGIPDSVDAMKAGAIDFLEKPVTEAKLFALSAMRSSEREPPKPNVMN